MTSCGFTENEFEQVSEWIVKFLRSDSEEMAHMVREEVRRLTCQFGVEEEI